MMGSKFKLDFKDKRYRYFQEMVQVRHRLMHPKSLGTFSVSDDEMIRIGQARDWFVQQASDLLNDRAVSGQFKSKLMPIECKDDSKKPLPFSRQMREGDSL